MIRKEINIHVFLSYRSHYQDELNQLENSFHEYNKLDSPYKITLMASEFELGKGDSILGFMDEIGEARFVIILLTKDYFDSPFCLHELLEIMRNKNIEERLFLLPVKIKDDVNTVTKDSVLQAILGDYKIELTDEKGHCQPRLEELQEKTLKILGIDANNPEAVNESIKARLEEAYTYLRKEQIDKKSPSVSLQQIPEIIIKNAKDAFNKEKQIVDEKLQTEITLLLKRLTQEDRNVLINELKKSADTEEELAIALLDKEVSDAIRAIQRWVINREKELKKQSDWEHFFRHIESICGWLLLNSVDNAWWIQNKLHLENSSKDKSHVDLGIEKPAYAEVIISRSIMQAAQFCLDGAHDAIPARFDAAWEGFPHENNLNTPISDGIVLDANDNARVEELLTPLIYDIKGRPPNISRDPEKLIKELIGEGEVMLDKTYYLVSQKYLLKLKSLKINSQSVLEQINDSLGDKLVFIGYGKQASVDESLCSNESKLLIQIAAILRIDNKRKPGNELK